MIGHTVRKPKWLNWGELGLVAFGDRYYTLYRYPDGRIEVSYKVPYKPGVPMLCFHPDGRIEYLTCLEWGCPYVHGHPKCPSCWGDARRQFCQLKPEEVEELRAFLKEAGAI